MRVKRRNEERLMERALYLIWWHSERGRSWRVSLLRRAALFGLVFICIPVTILTLGMHDGVWRGSSPPSQEQKPKASIALGRSFEQAFVITVLLCLFITARSRRICQQAAFLSVRDNWIHKHGLKHHEISRHFTRILTGFDWDGEAGGSKRRTCQVPKAVHIAIRKPGVFLLAAALASCTFSSVLLFHSYALEHGHMPYLSSLVAGDLRVVSGSILSAIATFFFIREFVLFSTRRAFYKDAERSLS